MYSPAKGSKLTLLSQSFYGDFSKTCDVVSCAKLLIVYMGVSIVYMGVS